ncbi:MAG: hypothetical protein AAB847_00365 [Patescibacteria group bacterium]
MANNKFLKSYANYLKKFLKLKRPLKIVFDASNGSGALLFKLVAEKNPKLSVIFLNDKPHGDFPGHGPNPLEHGATDELVAAVKKHQADLGIVVDNDADRVFFIDEMGRLLTSTESIIFLGDVSSGPMVFDFMIGPLAHQYFEKQNRRVITSRVGLYFIKKAMMENNASFGAEYSGHFYFPEVFGSDCAIMSAVHFLNKLSSLENGLGEWLGQLPRYHQQMVNFKCERQKFPQLARLLKSKFGKSARKISDLDGIKFEFDKHWFNLRPSNTEDLIRLTVEAQTPVLLDKSIKQLKNLLI